MRGNVASLPSLFFVPSTENIKSFANAVIQNGNIKFNKTNIVNQATLGAIGFDSKWIIIRNKGKMRKALLTYDSFATHTTLNKALK